MRIKLEYEDGPTFSTLSGPEGRYRAMIVKVGGKTFSTWRTLTPMELWRGPNDIYLKVMDDALVEAMEKMLAKVFLDACAAVPDGTQLL